MLPLIIAGLPVGAMYGLAALGMVLVHRGTRNLDLSLGATATAAAFAYHRLSTGPGAPAAVAMAGGMAVAAVIGLAGSVLSAHLGRDRPLAAAVGSLALAGVVLAGCEAAFGGETAFVPPHLAGVRVEVGGTVLSGHQLLLLGTAVAVAALGALLFRRTWTGLAWTASADDRTGALVSGLPVRRIETASYVAAALLAGLAGILLAPLLFLDPVQLAIFFLVKPFAAATVAGLSSLGGALAAGTAIGVLESMSVKVDQIPGLAEAVPLALVAGALLLRPAGRPREVATVALATGASRMPGRGPLWPAAVLVAGLVALGPHLSPYAATIVQLGAITAVLGASHVVMTGWVGQLFLAQPAFAGIGAVITARLAGGTGLPLPVTLAAGAAAAGLAAVIAGAVIATRATGVRLAAGTVALSAACFGPLFAWRTFAGTAEDRALPPAGFAGLELTGPRYTWVAVAVAAAAFAGLRALARSHWGAAMLAVREHEGAAVALGIPAARVRVAAFVVAGTLAGLAGALTAHQLAVVAVEQFHPLTALPLLSVAVVGGIESLWGAVLGAAFLTLAPELLRNTVSATVALLLPPGALLAAVVLRPGGLASLRPLGRGGWFREKSQPSDPVASEVEDGPVRGGPGHCGRPGPDEVGHGRCGPPGPSPGARREEAALVAEGVSVTFGDFVALDRVGLQVAPGEAVAVIGPNGAGKTTLFDAAGGFVPSAAETLAVSGTDLRRLGAHHRAGAGLVRTFQSGGLFPRLSVRENVALALRWHRRDTAGIDGLLAVTGLSPVAERTAAELPHGTARVAEIVRALALEPAVLLLDEPTSGLGRAESDRLMTTIRSLAGGAALVLVEHDLRVVEGSDRVVVLHAGRILAGGTPAEVREDPAVIAAYLGTPASSEVATAGRPATDP